VSVERSGRGTIKAGFAVTVFAGAFILSRLAEGPGALAALFFVLAFVAAVLFLFLFHRLTKLTVFLLSAVTAALPSP
jgi:hypothetical protein